MWNSLFIDVIMNEFQRGIQHLPTLNELFQAFQVFKDLLGQNHMLVPFIKVHTGPRSLLSFPMEEMPLDNLLKSSNTRFLRV